MEDKQQLLITIIVFAWVFMLYQFFFNWSPDFGYGGVFIGLILAGIAAAGTWFGYAKLK